MRGYRRVTRPARWTEVEGVSWMSLVADVDHRLAGLAGAVEQAGQVIQRDVHAHQRQVATDVLVLAVDQDEHGLVQRRRRQAGTGHIAHGRGRHRRLFLRLYGWARAWILPQRHAGTPRTPV